MNRTPAHRRPGAWARQQGFTLMLTLFVIVVALSAVLITYIQPPAQAINSDKVTAAALAQAKGALLGYAVSNATQPGILPCPDSDNDGTADSPCGALGVTAVGRFPWKTLGLPDIRDGSGECLWYAVSANFKNSGTSGPSTLTSDSPGTLAINDIAGTPVYAGSNKVLAIVFAPGIALSGQDRTPSSTTVCRGNTTVANYLEGGNQTGATTNIFIIGQASDFNDRSLPITGDALFPLVEYRVAREIRANLAVYFNANHYYPFANSYADSTFGCTPLLTRGRIPNPGNYSISTDCAGLADWPLASRPPAWFVTNNWNLLTDYTLAPACTNVTPDCAGAGYLTVNNTPAPNNDKRALVIVAGRALTGQGQLRPCASVTDCLEDENKIPNDIYIKNPVSSTFNDKLMIVAP